MSTIEETAPFVLQQRSGHVLWLRLNRPEQRNPLSQAMMLELQRSIEAAGNDPGVRAVVLAANGPVFCAGHDLREMQANSDAVGIRRILHTCAAMMQSIMQCPRAVIACVHGIASAAGCQLVSACDLAVASEDASFCTPGVNRGNFCSTPLVGIGRKLQRKHAMEMALTGDMFSAADAWRFGLVNRVVPADQLYRETEVWAQHIASKSVQGVAAGKQAFYEQLEMPIAAAFDHAGEAMIRGFANPDAREGTKAFFEKRAPRWEGLETSGQ